MSDTDADGTAVRLLARVARRVGSTLALDDTLVAVAEAVVDALGFRAAVVNLLGTDDQLHVVAVAGSDEVKLALAGTHSSRESWERMLAAATAMGELRFLPHGTELPSGTEDMHFYVPQLPTPEEEPARTWHPMDALFAPLVAGDGALLGVLSVDDPQDGLLPTPERAALLEAFAVQASLAIEHAREHAAIASSETLLRRLFDESPVAKTLIDVDGRIIRVNRAFCRFLGRDAAHLLGETPMAFTHPEDLDSTSAVLESVVTGAVEAGTVEKRYIHHDGHVVWGRVTLTRISDAAGGLLLSAVEDITEARAAAEQLRHLALHDSLTGLPNRTLVADRLEQALARARRDGTRVGIAVIDIDHFKLVNDSYGHPVGDQLLVATSEAIRASLRAFDTAGRLGGDELIVICEGMETAADLEGVAERLRAAARLTVTIGGTTLYASASVGCTLSRPDATPDELVAEADSALYRAKALGRGRCELFDEEMRRDSMALLQLRGELTQAMQRGEFLLHYQPIIDAGRGEAIGYEALLRWQHPQRGLLLPGEFLDAVADSELDHQLTKWVIGRACHDLRDLETVTGPATFVSVNLSPRQLARVDLADDVRAVLEATGLDAPRLWLEVTEQEVLDARHRAALQALRDLGCTIALDDFGTGYCGLAYLQQLPVQVLKIDREFVARITTDPVSAGITAAVTDLAKVLGIAVVAEGVETEEQSEALHAIGIHVLQGFSFAYPRPVETWTQAFDEVRFPDRGHHVSDELPQVSTR